MTEAVAGFLPYAFDTLRLHRVEAVTQPDNQPSIRVLEKTGFIREGYGRRMIKIEGIWTDHLMYAVLADDIGRGSHRA
jgi:ribosomal-protein-alanine N-acetyltransferase